MYLPRLLEQTIRQTLRTFPVTVITGPRQSGKSTMLRHMFEAEGASFLTLDDPEFRLLLARNPLDYLERLPKPVILDEIQFMPELLHHVKLLVDRDRSPGRWLVTGSQQFPVMKNVAESLAGRAAVLALPTLAVRERQTVPDTAECILRGSFPGLVTDPAIDRKIWYSSYLQTYLERDLRAMLQVQDLREFENFLRLLAARTAQELNLSRLAAETGVSVPTIKRWVSVLEAGYMVFLLPPWHANHGKRIVKTPKLHFLDTGLVTYLLDIHDPALVERGPLAGPLFETAVAAEFFKAGCATGTRPQLYHWRTHGGLEIDLLRIEDGIPVPYEVKAATTIKPAFTRNLEAWLALDGRAKRGFLVSDCRRSLPLPPGIANLHWSDIGREDGR